MKKIRNKIVLTMMLLTLLPAILIGTYSFYVSSEALRERALITQRHQLAQAQQVIQNAASRVESDLLFLRDSSAMQLYLASKKVSTKRGKVLLANLRHSIQQFTQQQQIYSAVRYMDLSGQEQVRVEKLEGVAKSFDKKSELINRKERRYFKASLTLQRNQIYISPLELRARLNKLIQPVASTIRYSTIVRDANGNKQGVLVLNLDADRLIEKITGEKDNQRTIALTDPEGFYYYHENESKRWSGPDNLNTQHNILVDEKLSLGSFTNSKKIVSSESESTLVLSLPVTLGENRPELGYLFSLAPKQALLKPLEDYISVSLIIVGISLVLSLTFAAILANSLSGPLVKLKDKVERLSRGDLESPIATRANDEIGELSRAVELLRKSMNILINRSGKPKL